jgi:ATP-dependent Clp protease ATP-binding subunit ClpB
MALNPEEFTDKLNELLREVKNVAIEASNPQMEPIHAAIALFKDENGLAKRVAEKAGALL